MAWNNAFPANNTKIRLDPAGVRANWLALETGGVPFDYLKLQLQASDPTREIGFGWLYSKAGGSTFAELFYMDDKNPASARVIRITRNGGVGYFNQTLYGDQIILNETSEFAYTQNAMISAAGTINTDGTKQPGSFNVGSTSVNGSSEYTINFIKDMKEDDEYVVVATIVAPGSNSMRVAVVTAQEDGLFKVTTWNNGSLSDKGFSFIVVGGLPGE